MDKDDYIKVDGFKEVLADKIYFGIRSKIENVSLPELMQATNIFGRGFAAIKFMHILEKNPDILVSDKSYEEKKQALLKVAGIAQISVDKFLKNITTFVEWCNIAGLEEKLVYISKQSSADTGHDLFGQKWVITGFRDKELVEKLRSVGAVEQSAVSKKTFMVIVKDTTEDTGKAEQARKLGVPLMTPDEVIKKFNL